MANPTNFGELYTKIQKKTASIDVVGLGYVGWPLAKALKKAGFNVRGIDKSNAKVAERLRESTDIILATAHHGAAADVVIVCVPTPLKNSLPDHSMVFDAVFNAGATRDSALGRQRLLIIESTIAPFTTEKVASSCADGWYVAHAPERIDPGNEGSYHAACPKVVGGVTEGATLLTGALYEHICPKVFKCLDSVHAELAKLWENTFRLINISAVNEFSEACHAMGVDVHQVIDAAATKPFGFMPFRPGPGAGGHCIPIDPVFLYDAVARLGYRMTLLRAAIEKNEDRPKEAADHVLGRYLTACGDVNISESTVLILGETYKANTHDKRCAASAEVEKELERVFKRVDVLDPVTGRHDPLCREPHDVLLRMVRHDDADCDPTNHSARVYVDATSETY